MCSNVTPTPIPLSVPHLTGNEWQYVKECLDTNWVSYVGPFVNRFERQLANKAGAKFAVATSSGTAALHVALLLAGVGANDEVLMPGLSFVAPANAIRYCGAWPTFSDIHADDWQWNIEEVSRFLSRACVVRGGRLFNRSTNRRIAALLPVHLLGGLCDVDAVGELAAQYELPVVEDAAECLGATYKGRPIAGPCPTYRGPLRLVVTSFNGNKIVTTGGGGAILCEDGALAASAKHLTTTAKTEGCEFLHDAVGYNYRLTNIAAAVGVAQLERLDEFVGIKRGIASRYADSFAGCSQITSHPEPRECRSTFWMYSVELAFPARPIIERLNKAGIAARPLWMPLSRLSPFSNCFVWGELPVLSSLYTHGISIPCSVGLTELDQGRVCETLVGAFRRGTDIP